MNLRTRKGQDGCPGRTGLPNNAFAVDEPVAIAPDACGAYMRATEIHAAEAAFEDTMIFPVESQTKVRTTPQLPMTTRFGAIHIAVTDKAKALAIWQDVVGLQLISETPTELNLGVAGKTLVTLELGAARPVVGHTIGLYHVAIHVPTRPDLAQMAMRALQRRVRISPTDHLSPRRSTFGTSTATASK